MRRRSRRSERPLPTNPYRDAALVYGFMAIALVIVATLTGGDVARAGLVAVIFFVVATAWSWWRFWVRIREREAATAAESANETDGSQNGNGNGNGNGAGKGTGA